MVVVVTSLAGPISTTTTKVKNTTLSQSSESQGTVENVVTSASHKSDLEGTSNSSSTAKISSTATINSLTSVNPQTGDNLSIILNIGAGVIDLSIEFREVVSSTEINASVLYMMYPTTGSPSVIANGTFVLNTTSFYIPSANNITWANTTCPFIIPTGLSVGSHLQIGSDTNATIVNEFTYHWLGLSYTVQNITYIDGTAPVYSLYDKNSGIMLYYYQYTTGYHGWLNTSSLITINPLISENNPPVVTSAGSFTYTNGTTGHNITWLPSDANPDHYIIYRNGSTLVYDYWASNTPIVYSVDGLNIGVYNFTIHVFDINGLMTSNSLLVTVTASSTFPPTINSPADINYAFGTIGTNISWLATDIDPNSYSIFLNGSLTASGSWTTGNIISINIDGLAVGVYNYTIVVTDSVNLTATDTVFVTVYNLINYPPTIDHPADSSYLEGSTGHTISWNPADTNPNSYSLYRNDSLIDSGVWSSSQPISVNIDNLNLGTYNYTLLVSDQGGLTASDTVFVTVTNSPPTIDSPADQSFQEGSTGYTISWNPVDTNPNSYTLFRNSSLIGYGTWASSAPITVSLNGLTAGTYNFTIQIFDSEGLAVSDTVWITVNENINVAPTIDNPPDITYDVGTTGVSINWTATDSNPGTYTVIRMDKVLISSYWTSGKVINVNVDGLDVGLYNYTIVVSDTKGLTASDTVFVKVVQSDVSQSSSSSSSTSISNSLSSSRTTLTAPTPGFEFPVMLLFFSLVYFFKRRRKY